MDALPGIVAMAGLGGSIWVLARMIGYSRGAVALIIFLILVLPFLLLALALIRPEFVFIVGPLEVLAPMIPFVVLFSLCLSLQKKGA